MGRYCSLFGRGFVASLLTIPLLFESTAWITIPVSR
jgi:hypothetical protein